MKLPVFKSERLRLVPFTKDDGELFHQLNTDPFIRKFMWDDDVIPASLADEILEKNETCFKENRYGLWKILSIEENKIIGYTGLWYFFNEPQPQLIYALLAPFTRKGFATEAAKMITDYAFSTLKFKYLIAATDEPHLASQRVAERLGMQYVEKRMENGKPTLFYRIEA